MADAPSAATNVQTARWPWGGNQRRAVFLALRVRTIANWAPTRTSSAPSSRHVGDHHVDGSLRISTALDAAIDGGLHQYGAGRSISWRGPARAGLLLVGEAGDQSAAIWELTPDDDPSAHFIKAGRRFPYLRPLGRNFDVGDFRRATWNWRWSARLAALEQRLVDAKAAGKDPRHRHGDLCGGRALAGSEGRDHLKLQADGTVTLYIGTQSNGQGHATAYAQFVAEKLGLGIDQINVRQGDSDELEKGGGTGGSRSIPLGGVSAARAGDDLAEKLKKLAADELEAAPADIELVNGSARIVGTDRSMDFSALAAAAGSEDDIKGFGEFVQDEATYPNGTHICEVEIDPETGRTDIVGYTIVDDFGATVNPMLLAGQVHGGVAQGIGQALIENTTYSEDGQLVSATFMDYGMPRADDMPFFGFETRNVPSTTNAMGIKGAGEAGTIGAAPAVINAVTDALYRAYGIQHIDMPATPPRIWQAIQAAGSRG